MLLQDQIVFVPETVKRSQVTDLSSDWALKRPTPIFVILPAVPARIPFTYTRAMSSTATEIDPEMGVPGRSELSG